MLTHAPRSLRRRGFTDQTENPNMNVKLEVDCLLMSGNMSTEDRKTQQNNYLQFNIPALNSTSAVFNTQCLRSTNIFRVYYL